jgi:hypothetical protein
MSPITDSVLLKNNVNIEEAINEGGSFLVLLQGFQEVRRAQISETVRLPKNKRYPKQTRHLEH